MTFLEPRWPPPATDTEQHRVRALIARPDITIDGYWTGEVEAMLRQITGAEHAIAYSSCTAAIHAALIARQLDGHLIQIPVLTFTGSWTGAAHLNCQPAFCDVYPDDLTIQNGTVFPGAGTIAVDLHGAPHHLPRHESSVITDSCQAIGTTIDGRHIGSTGTHCWSFSSTKLIAAPGGGAVTTDSAHRAATLRMLRDYGTHPDGGPRASRSVLLRLGHNWRPSEIDMAIVASRLTQLPILADRAHQIGEELRHAAQDAGYRTQRPIPTARPAWHKIRLQAADIPSRDRLERALANAGIPTHRWGLPLNRMAAWTRARRYPIADAAHDHHLCLGTETIPPVTWTADEIRQAVQIIHDHPNPEIQ